VSFHTLDVVVLNIDAENKQLTKEIQALRTDPTTIERLAREVKTG